MGCMRKLGCLLVLALICAAAYLTRDMWMSRVPGLRRSRPDTTALTSPTWQSMSPAGARRAKASLERLAARNGPASVNVAPGDLAAYIFQELAAALPTSADSVEAAAIGDRLYVRAIIPTRELAGTGALGPLAALLGDRERVQMGGTLRIIRLGFAELRVQDMKIGNITVPKALIPRLVQQISRGTRPPELSPDGLPLRTPEYIGDVRVSNGTITLYKAATR